MPELYQSLGFMFNPFSRFSAEEELDYLPEVFMKPRYFDVLTDDLLAGNTRFITGDRGSGKSALMYSLIEKLIRKNSFTLLIDTYHGIPSQNNGPQFLRSIIEYLVTDYSLLLMMNNKKIRSLSNHNKENLSMLISVFFQPLNRKEIEQRIDRLTNYKKWNIVKKFINRVFNRSLNIILSGTAELISDVISKSLGLPKINTEKFYKEYIPDLKETSVADYSNCNINNLDYQNLKKILVLLRDIIIESGFTSITIFFDKIDEFQVLEGKTTKIADFLRDITTDTSLLQIKKISFVFITWSRVKSTLSLKNVRFDKFKPVDVNWTNEDMEKILEKRIKYFSNEKKNLRDIFDSISLGIIIELSNGSPRDVINLVSNIYDEQSMEDPKANKFNKTSIDKGTRRFVTKYDYNSYYGYSEIANSVIKSINRILQVGKSTFLLKDIAEVTKRSQASASNYSRNMKEYGLINENESTSEQIKEYTIIDPKIKFLISNGIKKIG